MNDPARRVSVVVPTYRRPDLLDRCLRALVGQDFPASAYEIVVADDAASEETRRQVERWGARAAPSVRYVPVVGPRHGPAAARNRGWRAAGGAVIAFTDDDAIADRGWLRHGLATFADGVAGAWGRLVVPLPDTPTDYERDARGLEIGPFVTANCFYRRDALEAAGGFDERFTSAWREDSDLFFSMVELGLRLVRAPHAVVVHPVRPARWGVSLSQQRKAVFNALLWKKHPTLYRQAIRAGPPWGYYATVAALAGAAAGVLTRRRRLALGCLAAWGALTAEFCARRLAGTSRAPSHVAEMVVTSALIPPLSVYWRLRGALRYRALFL
jgi:cellulose synthase/poly-beta-1,6-N-acetylglucosamine synthase-like glycosyltransferase